LGHEGKRTLGKYEDNLTHELIEAAKLDLKQRGELAELAFMRKAASMGFAVAKPWGDSDRYDVIVRFGKLFWRVQVKSVLATLPSRSFYRVRTTGAHYRRYSAEDIDFLAAYIFAEDLWYIFPVEVIENRDSVALSPSWKKSRFVQYREAWDLMKPKSIAPATILRQPAEPSATATGA
jgi:PD-(D/E)XK endonuclease